MSSILVAIGIVWAVSSLLQIATLALVGRWVRKANTSPPKRNSQDLVSIIRPVCGIPNGAETALRSTFQISDLNYEVIFCVHSDADPAIPPLRKLIEKYPRVPTKLLIGDSNAFSNPKVNNLLKSWEEIRGDWVTICDDNVILPEEYLDELFLVWGPKTGAVSTISICCNPKNFWAELECAFMNPFQVRWYFAAAALGKGFVNGKTMMMRKTDLVAAGGMEMLAHDVVEDVAVTKYVLGRDLRIDVPRMPLVQNIEARKLGEVWDRQARWSRIRRLSYLPAFLTELFSGALVPTLCAGWMSHAAGHSFAAGVFAEAALWYGSEWLFLMRLGWHWSRWTPIASALRDLMLPALWLRSWSGESVSWRNKQVLGRAPQI